MPRIEALQSEGATAPAPDLEYEDVRQSFLVRLRGERASLEALTSALGSAAPPAALAFVGIEGFAHRLRGAAAVFDFPELRDCAKVLELAAKAAVLKSAPFDEPMVRKAARELQARLCQLISATPSADVTALG